MINGVGLKSFSNNAAPDYSGKTAVVTGATSGIGFATALLMAARGAFVIGAGRTKESCAGAQERIRGLLPDARVAFTAADLSAQRQVKGLAASVKELSGGRLDALVNNAGAVSSWFMTTEDGIEMQFAVNYLAPFLLTQELLPLLEKAPQGRVVNLSSGSHNRTRLNFDDLQMRGRYSCLAAYKRTKLEMMMFTLELNRRLGEGAGVRAAAVDPGLVRTEIGLKHTGGLESLVWKWRMRSGIAPSESAETIAFAAFDPSLSQRKQAYWKGLAPIEPSGYAKREDEAQRLWEISAQLCGLAQAEKTVYN
ncbi:MAG: SDR family NAD(P)-dependent oxidoreductase [Clostridia bacterium]|nr:SDR family NAD(P)-dependent oxidoreductase [Clostridia bacterium]